MTVLIVDYGVGNLGSIANMFGRIGVDVVVSGDPADVATATKLLLPGVGSFDRGMQTLEASGLVPALEHAVFRQGKPVLGICLGMQLLGQGSEEGTKSGLGWIDAKSIRFRQEHHPGLRVPHMGWSDVTVLRSNPLLDDDPAPRYYFAHSFHVRCENTADPIGESIHGEAFVCALWHDNIFGVQFHPEKSHRFGMDLLRRFAKLG
jgi:glutamine amidotransferase